MQSSIGCIDSASRTPRTSWPALVVGEVMVDRFADGDVVGAAPFNAARSLAASGVLMTFISRIGDDDDDGSRVLASALRVGLHGRPIQRDLLHATGVTTVIERNGEHRFEIHADVAWDHLDLNEARAARGYAAFDLRGRCIAQGAAHAVTTLVDTVGAGDAFSAASIALQSAGCAAAASLAANRDAAAVCGQRGALPKDAALFRGWRATLGLQPSTPALA
jgi:sugar/nucleoside kinase (ribokinase family)